MFAGITQGLFPVVWVQRFEDYTAYKVRFDDRILNNLEIGASISIDGVCQTVVSVDRDVVLLNAGLETLKKTTLDDLFVNRQVSIERSARYGTEIGGHQMFGHVFGVANIVRHQATGNNLLLTFECSKEMMPYLFVKGFVGVDGSSLTVNDVQLQERRFSVNLIPHTIKVTGFKNKKVRDRVNIELDATTVTIVDTIMRMGLKKLFES